jgi:hypothetical protein
VYSQSLASRLAAATLAVTLANVSQAQIPRTTVPTARPPLQPQGTVGMNAASPTVRLVVWINGRGTVLNGLTAATGPGGASLPTGEQIRAQHQLGQLRRPPGILLIQVQPRSQASEALSRLNACNPPACLIQIDQLGPNGQVVASHSFSGGTATEQAHTNELEEFQVTFQKITFTNTLDSTTARDDWLTN